MLTLADISSDDLRQSIASCDQRIRDLEVRYGTGSRPDWVGEDIGIEMAHRSLYQHELERRSISTGDSK